uniref:Glutathione transferase n=1 Tax=Sphenodon punctatus TaxID=8508 RepID=A0A8D0HGH0_SPHPU
MGLELYLDLLSQPCRAVYIFAKKNNIPFTFKPVEVLKGEEGERFGKVNILRRVPALKDGAFTLAESMAILIYLSQKYKTPDHWYPSDIQRRARVDEYLSWQHVAIRANGVKLFWLKVVFPLFMDQLAPEEKLQEAFEDLAVSLKQLEEKFLQDKPFIAGNRISLADLVAITELMQVGDGTWGRHSPYLNSLAMSKLPEHREQSTPWVQTRRVLSHILLPVVLFIYYSFCFYTAPSCHR